MTDMFSPGGTLRAAREKLKLTQADIAESTRIKIHMVDAIENNDFSRISAPLYGKGFIKLYAEKVGLDPAPLVRDYLIRHGQVVRPTLKADGIPPGQGRAEPSGAPVARGPARPVVSPADLLEAGRAAAVRMARDVDVAVRQAARAITSAWASRQETGRRLMRDPRLAREYGRGTEWTVGRYAALGMAIIVVAIFIGFGVNVLIRRSGPERPAVVEARASGVAKPATPAVSPRLRLAQEPPAPYLKPRKP